MTSDRRVYCLQIGHGRLAARSHLASDPHLIERTNIWPEGLAILLRASTDEAIIRRLLSEEDPDFVTEFTPRVSMRPSRVDLGTNKRSGTRNPALVSSR